MISKNYRSLFESIALMYSNLAEKAMEMDHEQGKDDTNATKMRDDFVQLMYNIKDENYTLTKEDYIKLLIAAKICAEQINSNIKTWKTVYEQYSSMLIPKIEQVIDAKDNYWAEAEKVFNENE